FPQAPYTLVYTAEGLCEDVAAEILQAKQLLQASHCTEINHNDRMSGNDIWAGWLRANIPVTPNGRTFSTVSRLGVGSRRLPGILKQLGQTSPESSFVADLANGLAMIRDEQTPTLRQMAHQAGGYLVILSAPKAAIETNNPWGFPPECLQLIKQLKDRWDKNHLFNPGVLGV
ncbi:MAG: hypothetical protein Q8O57_10275, partial [Kiritimatiellota bacterium]|nr:hypothetical protein [Kiritimatiellota bacterium]